VRPACRGASTGHYRHRYTQATASAQKALPRRRQAASSPRRRGHSFHPDPRAGFVWRWISCAGHVCPALCIRKHCAPIMQRSEALDDPYAKLWPATDATCIVSTKHKNSLNWISTSAPPLCSRQAFMAGLEPEFKETERKSEQAEIKSRAGQRRCSYPDHLCFASFQPTPCVYLLAESPDCGATMATLGRYECRRRDDNPPKGQLAPIPKPQSNPSRCSPAPNVVLRVNRKTRSTADMTFFWRRSPRVVAFSFDG
jgi:hypothetical protein